MICALSLRSLAAFALGVTALQAKASAEEAPSQLQALLNHSPFGHVEIGAGPAIVVDSPLEFRGVLEEHGRKLFSVYETGTRRTAWVDLNDLVNGFSVKAYHDEQPNIVVEYQGKILTLALKRAAAGVRATPQISSGPVQSLTSTPANPPPIDPVRLKAVEKELQRRYAENRNGYTSPTNDPTATGRP